MSESKSRLAFTATQWQELEHQALIFKYMVSGLPIPPDLLFTLKRSLDSSSPSSNLVLHQPQNVGWNYFQMGFGRKFDPEPGRCRRTDGKKWRCSKKAYPDTCIEAETVQESLWKSSPIKQQNQQRITHQNPQHQHQYPFLQSPKIHTPL